MRQPKFVLFIPAGSRSSPDWLAPDGSKLRPPARSGAAQGPAYPATAAARAAAAGSSDAAGSGGDSGADGGGDGGLPRGVGAILSREELAEMQLLANSDELDLPKWQKEERQPAGGRQR